jgi:hypothetical protein
MNSHRFRFRAFPWRLGVLGAVALAALTALTLGHLAASAAGDKGVDGDSVTVPADLAWVSPDAAVFATVRPAALWNSAEGKIMREQFPELADDIERSLEREVALKPAELENLTLVIPDWSFLGGRGYSGEGAGKSDAPGAPIKEAPKEPNEPKQKQPPATTPANAVAVAQPPDRQREPEFLLIATATEPAALARVFKDVTTRGTARGHKGKTYYTVKTDRELSAYYFVNERTLVRGSVKQIMKGLERTGTETKGPLAPALRLAKEKHHLAVGLQLTEKEAADILRDISEISRERNGIARALKPLFQARAAAGFADVGKDTRAAVQLFFRDGTQAKAALPAAEDALALLRIHVLNEWLDQLEEELLRADNGRREEEAMFGIQILEKVESGLRGFKAEAKGALLRVQALAATDLVTMVAKNKELLKARAGDETYIAAKNRKKSQNNLRQIGLALHNLNDVHKRLPPAALCDKQGKPCLSWRVAILPYIEQQALYNQFKLDEPWDSANNIKLLAQMPKTFAPVGMKTKEPGLTFYQGFVADPKLPAEHLTAWETTVDANSPFGAWGTRMPHSFPDGTSNTIWVVEGGDAVPWTKPVDLPYDPKKPLPKLGGNFKDGFNALFVDASTRFIPHDFDVRTLRLLITRQDGQPLGPAFYKLR